MSTDRRAVVPEGHEETYSRFRFAPALKVGETVYVSGVIGLGPDGKAPEDTVDEVAALFTQLAATLQAAGATLNDIVDMTSFHVDMAGIRELVEAKHDLIGEPYPAWTAIGCSGLVMPGARVELKATAVISDST